MNLEQLKTVIWLAELKSFGQVAHKMNTTQPGITNRIHSLEKELGFKLFDRTTRNVHTTSEGQICLAYAKKIVNLLDKINHISPGDPKISGLCTLGVTESIALSWLPSLMTRIHNEYPQLEVDIDVGPTPYLFERLIKGDIDMTMAGGLPIQTIGKNLVFESLGSLKLAWVISSDSELFPDNGKPYTPAQLKDERIFVYSRRALLHDTVLDWFHSNKTQLGRINMCDSIPSTQAMIKSGLGISLLPLQLVMDSINKGELREIVTKPPAPTIDFYTSYINNQGNMIPKLLVEIAKSVSDFPR